MYYLVGQCNHTVIVQGFVLAWYFKLHTSIQLKEWLKLILEITIKECYCIEKMVKYSNVLNVFISLYKVGPRKQQ